MRLFLCLLLLQIASAAVKPSNTVSFQDHHKLVMDFRCKVPQKRAIPLQDIFKELPVNKKIIPSTTVLHRCEGSGSCDESRKCGVATSDLVELTFQMIPVLEGDVGATQTLRVKAANHTACSCLKTDLPK